jgi:hypothetical protein
MKIYTFLLLSLFFLCQTFFCYSYLRKVKAKGDIPKFCKSDSHNEDAKPRAILDMTIPIKNSSFMMIKTINNTILNSEEKSTYIKSIPKTTILKNLYSKENYYFNLLETFLGFYFYFIILNLLKILEEIYRNLLIFINARFSHFEDLTILNYPDMEKYENKFIYTSGLLFFEQPAIDPIFNFDYGKVFLKIERRVSLYDFDLNNWIDCDSLIESEIQDYFEKIKNSCNTKDENLNVYKNILENLKNEVFIGKATLRGVRMSDKHLKKLQNFEIININNRESLEACENYFQKHFGSGTEKISFSIDDPLQTDFSIFISDNESGNGIPFLKIRLVGVSKGKLKNFFYFN